MLHTELRSARSREAVEGTAWRPDWALVATTALAFVIVMEVLRTLYPLGYALVGDLGFVVAPMILLVLFLSPVVAPLLRFAGGRGSIVVAGSLLAVGRLALQLMAPSPLWAAAVAVIFALVAITVMVAAVMSTEHGGATTALGFVSAIGIDAALKGAFAAWDRVWQPGVGPMLVTVALLVTFGLVTDRALRHGLALDGEPAHGRMGRMLALVVLLMPAMLLFGSIAFVASSGGLGLPAATITVVVGAAVSLAVIGVGGTAIRTRRAGALAGVALAAVSWAMTNTTGVIVAVLAVAGQVLTGMLLIALLAGEPSSPRAHGIVRTSIGAAIGFAGMFTLTVLYPMHYEMPLPVSNSWLPVIAVLAALAALAGCRREETAAAEPAATTQPIWRPALALGIAGFGVGLFLIASAAERPATVSAQMPLTVGTFNLDQGARESGALDFAAAAEVVRSLDADVVALQETARGWPLSGMNDFALWFEHTDGVQTYFAPAADHQFGNLLVSRVDVSDIETLALPQGDGSMRRSAIVATVPTPDGPVTVIAVHLQHRNSAAGIEARQQELQVILDRWAGAPRTVVLGDFNSDNQRAPGGGPKLLEGPAQRNTLQPLLDAGFTTTQPTQLCTAPTSNDNCSDFVLVTPDLLLDPPVAVLDDQPVGDHRPVVAVVASR